MRFLLINPFYPISETPSPPLGLAFIAAALERAGIEVRVLDFVVYPYSKDILESEIKAFSPDFVGATSVTMSFNDAISIIRDIKSIDSKIITIMGGPHATFNFKETLKLFPELDFIVLGEGEDAVVALANALGKRKELKNVKGIAYKSGSEIINTGLRKPTDINELPLPARHLIPLGRYRALGMPVSMTSSRGCPFKCIFCVGRKMSGGKVRYRNPKSVVDEMAYLNTMKFHQINLADDLFTSNNKHCIDVCNEILKRNLSLSWTSFARVDTVSPEVLKKMREAGCHTVSFGVESGNPEMLKRIKKGITLEQVIEAIRMCNEAGIAPHASFILGLPNETPETIMDTVSFGEKLKDMGVQHGFHLLAPFPGTEVREKINQYDLKILSANWSDYHANRAIVETSSVAAETMNKIVLEWEKKYNDYLGDLKTLRENGTGTYEEIWPLTRLEHTIVLYDLMMERIMEKYGSFDKQAVTWNEESSINEFIKKIKTNKIKYSSEELKTTLDFAVKQGYITCSEDRGKIKWKWVDYLK